MITSVKQCICFASDLDGSANSLTERRRAGPPENTTTYSVSSDYFTIRG